MRRAPAIALAVLAALALCGPGWTAPAPDVASPAAPAQAAPAAPDAVPGCPAPAELSPDTPAPAAQDGPAKPAAVNLSGVWDATAQGSKLEAFVTQKGPFLLAVAYVTQPDGRVSSYHMAGVLDNGRVHVAHRDGYVFDGQALGPDSVCGAVTIKNYPIKIETTAVRRVRGRLHDEQADAFFKEMLPLLPAPGK
jgi:hypothetical protein